MATPPLSSGFTNVYVCACGKPTLPDMSPCVKHVRSSQRADVCVVMETKDHSGGGNPPPPWLHGNVCCPFHCLWAQMVSITKNRFSFVSVVLFPFTWSENPNSDLWSLFKCVFSHYETNLLMLVSLWFLSQSTATISWSSRFLTQEVKQQIQKRFNYSNDTMSFTLHSDLNLCFFFLNFLQWHRSFCCSDSVDDWKISSHIFPDINILIVQYFCAL